MPDGIVPIGPVEDFGSVVVPDAEYGEVLKRFGVIDGFMLSVGTTLDPLSAGAVWYNGQEIL